jgi:hypothetical protein
VTKIGRASLLWVVLLAGAGISCRPQRTAERTGAAWQRLPLRFSERPASESAVTIRYRYSVVPGGVHDQLELARAMRTDGIVAQHYAGINADKVLFSRLEKGRDVYVSYRVDDAIFWTRHRIHLPRGEAVLTSGVQQVRVRCGNRISDTPRLPVEISTPPRNLDQVESISVIRRPAPMIFRPITVYVESVRRIPPPFHPITNWEPTPGILELIPPEAVPEPATFALCFGALGLMVFLIVGQVEARAMRCVAASPEGGQRTGGAGSGSCGRRGSTRE